MSSKKKSGPKPMTKTEIMRALHSLTPESIDFDAEEQSASGIYRADREPTLVELYSRALAHNVQKLPNFARFSLGTARRVAALGADALTRFNNLGEGGFVANVRSLLTGDLSTLKLLGHCLDNLVLLA